jgi:hypothetical protein
MTNNRRINLVDTDFIDRLNVFVEVNSPAWRSPVKISLEDLFKGVQPVSFVEHEQYDISKDIDHNTLIIDKDTLKIKVNSSILSVPSVFSEPYSDQNISYNLPPKNTSTLTGVHMMIDQNYLFIWTGDKWKRVLLSNWY